MSRWCTKCGDRNASQHLLLGAVILILLGVVGTASAQEPVPGDAGVADAAPSNPTNGTITPPPTNGTITPPPTNGTIAQPTDGTIPSTGALQCFPECRRRNPGSLCQASAAATVATPAACRRSWTRPTVACRLNDRRPPPSKWQRCVRWRLKLAASRLQVYLSRFGGCHSPARVSAAAS